MCVCVCVCARQSGDELHGDGTASGVQGGIAFGWWREGGGGEQAKRRVDTAVKIKTGFRFSSSVYVVACRVVLVHLKVDQGVVSDSDAVGALFSPPRGVPSLSPIIGVSSCARTHRATERSVSG